jgi:hypothetical protein
VTGAPGPNEGTYRLDLPGTGPYTVTPSKVGGTNTAINSFDAARIAAHVAGISNLSGNQFVAADVSGNGLIQSFDAALIARFVTTTPGWGATGTWKFFTVSNVPFPVGSTPTSRTYPSLTGDLIGQDYTAILMGEVSGNWTNTGARPADRMQKAAAEGSGPVQGLTIEAPNVVSEADKQIVIPVRIDHAADRSIVSYEFNLRYDPSVIRPVGDGVETVGTLSRGLNAVANPSEPGLIRVAVYGPLPIEGDGILLNLRFIAVGASGSVSPLIWEHVLFNDGERCSTCINGRVELAGKEPGSRS